MSVWNGTRAMVAPAAIIAAPIRMRTDVRTSTWSPTCDVSAHTVDGSRGRHGQRVLPRRPKSSRALRRSSSRVQRPTDEPVGGTALARSGRADLLLYFVGVEFDRSTAPFARHRNSSHPDPPDNTATSV